MPITARMTNPAFALAGAPDALKALAKAINDAQTPVSRELVHLRASQINGCSACVDGHAKQAREAGESAERVSAVAAWRETLYFSDPERAALALTEALTRVADRAEPVPDAIWNAAAEHFDETQLGALVLDIALVNLWNRLNIATRQIAGDQTSRAHRPRHRPEN
jgi:AhpD family alkylhydroperoxidase